MARNDYMNEPVEMIALQGWTGLEGKVRRNDRITVTERRARELEGYTRTRSPRMSISGERRPAGEPIRVPARAKRVHPRDGQTKGGPTPDHAKGRAQKAPQRQEDERVERKREQRDHEPDSGGGATASAQARAEELGISLSAVQGSGANGRITKPDVERAHELIQKAPKPTGDQQLDRFVADLQECTLEELREQRALYADEPDARFAQAVDAEIEARG